MHFENQGKKTYKNFDGITYSLIMIKLLMPGVCSGNCCLYWSAKNYKNTHALSIVMGHEIAHAVARHFERIVMQ